MGANILIIEDDIALGKFLARELERRSFSTEVCTGGREALSLLLPEARHDLLILDLNLPEFDGMDLLRRLRTGNPHLPVLVLTARNRTEDLVQGLNEGADDFLFKPFSLKELMARVDRLMRRGAHKAVEHPQTRPADLVLNHDSYSVTRSGRRIELTPREFAMLEYLVAHAGKVVTRKDLIERVWQTPQDPSSNVVDVYMKYLRDKLDTDGEGKLIRTVRGIGYVLELEQNDGK